MLPIPGRVLALNVVLPSEGNNIMAVLRSCIYVFHTDSLYCSTVCIEEIHAVTNTIQYSFTAVLPLCIKEALLTSQLPPQCRSLPSPEPQNLSLYTTCLSIY
jgi:hypothetical protein